MNNLAFVPPDGGPTLEIRTHGGPGRGIGVLVTPEWIGTVGAAYAAEARDYREGDVSINLTISQVCQFLEAVGYRRVFA